ncbi:hypothetical protein DPEC_G00205200 [Dallia pectoralis]|uniref:Uncharacterized protein n=1 Tax=Dallia pectoralis TaxID=75939 RepID=A0ACC2G4T4_DALPE|nr:hypothetical protein DPEC_G00205200 [Dallia pectoralis]
MDPKKVQAVQEWPRPNSRKELQRPGSQNGKPDALSRVFSKEETRKTPETILPLRRVVGALQWGIEGKVRAALRGDPGPGNGPPGRLFVPEGMRPAVLEWGHSSKLTCHPGVARTMSFLRRRFWWPAMELDLRDFVALCELESGIPAVEIQITYAEQPLKDLTRAIGTYGLKDGDVVVLRQAERRPQQTQPAFPGLPRIDFSSIAVPGTSSGPNQRSTQRKQQPAATPQQLSSPPAAPPSLPGSSPQGLDDPALLQQMLLANPHELSLLKERNPVLAEALLSGDLERFTKVLLEQQQDRARREQERIRLLTADPFDMEAQAKIEEDIRQHNVEENMTIAMEEAPESFGQVVMLYINCIVNGYHVKAFVDSGAQMTIMSQACAKRCNIMRLVDRRWAGIAKGVGTQKIIGRVHLAQVQIEGDFLPCSFSILEDQPMDMLLGLDMLKRHQCSIDLKKNTLLIGTTGTETRFLPEAELPECARLAYGPEGREDTVPDEVADRELAEALQRSVQESGHH